jgi:[acyl-carrier-protein] S-malonyltransferase
MALSFYHGKTTVLTKLVRSPLLHLRMSSDSDFEGYSSKKTFFFPGQGAQYVGMASKIVEEVPKAKELFDKASEILGYDLLQRCKEGPKDSLDSTAVSQPAIFVASMAALEKLKSDQGASALDSVTCAMGLSLGEYSALCFAGAISFEDGVKVTKARGEAMQAASDMTPTGMASIIGLSSDKVKEMCEVAAKKSGESVQIGNYLCTGNYAVSGTLKALGVVDEIAKPDFGARMTVRLAVAGAFHTQFMAPAVPKLGVVLDTIEIKRPRIPVISNVDALPHSDPAVIKENLKKQVTSPVLFENSVAAVLAHGFEEGFELGPGKVVSGIVKRIDKNANVVNIEV